MADLTWYQKILSHPRLQRVIANRFGRVAIALGISCLAHVPCVLMLTGTLVSSGAVGALLMHPLAIMASSFALLLGGHLASKALCNRYCAWANCLLADARPTLAPVQSFAQGVADARRARQWHSFKNTGLTVAAFGIAGVQGFFIAPLLHRHHETMPPIVDQPSDRDVGQRGLVWRANNDQTAIIVTIAPDGAIQAFDGVAAGLKREAMCGGMMWAGVYRVRLGMQTPLSTEQLQAAIHDLGYNPTVTVAAPENIRHLYQEFLGQNSMYRRDIIPGQTRAR